MAFECSNGGAVRVGALFEHRAYARERPNAGVRYPGAWRPDFPGWQRETVDRAHRARWLAWTWTLPKKSRVELLADSLADQPE